MQRGKFVDLLPCVICLGLFCPNFIVSNFKFKVKSNCILIVHSDHVVELVDLINMSMYWGANLITLVYMFINLVGC